MSNLNVTLFTPHSGQRKVINGFADSPHKFGVVVTSRQWGKSLLAQNLLLYWLLQNPGQKGCWVSPVYNQCRKVFQELTNASYEIITKSNKAELTVEFVNGSTLIFLSSERPDSIRGFSFNYVIVDEASFVSEQAVNQAIFPTLSALGKKCLIISTPKSKNWFFNTYLKGLDEGSDYISFRGLSADNPYIDQSFIDEQRKSLPASIFKQEYEAEFTDSGNDVFTGIDYVCNINQWDVPQRNGRYYFGIDTGLTNDYSVLTIIDESGRVAKIIRVNGLPFEEIGKSFIAELKRYPILGGYVESNSIGRPMFELIKSEIRKTQDFYTTNETKNQGIRNLIYKIQQGELELPDDKLFPHLKQELQAYTYKISANGLITFNAPNGLHDDCIISLMLANEAREKIALRKSSLYVGQGNKVDMQTKVNWGL
jgi:hypothetical protein